MKADCGDEGTAMDRLPGVDQRLRDAMNRALADSGSVNLVLIRRTDVGSHLFAIVCSI